MYVEKTFYEPLPSHFQSVDNRVAAVAYDHGAPILTGVQSWADSETVYFIKPYQTNQSNIHHNNQYAVTVQVLYSVAMDVRFHRSAASSLFVVDLMLYSVRFALVGVVGRPGGLID